VQVRAGALGAGQWRAAATCGDLVPEQEGGQPFAGRVWVDGRLHQPGRSGLRTGLVVTSAIVALVTMTIVRGFALHHRGPVVGLTADARRPRHLDRVPMVHQSSHTVDDRRNRGSRRPVRNVFRFRTPGIRDWLAPPAPCPDVAEQRHAHPSVARGVTPTQVLCGARRGVVAGGTSRSSAQLRERRTRSTRTDGRASRRGLTLHHWQNDRLVSADAEAAMISARSVPQAVPYDPRSITCMATVTLCAKIE
jgi:hypothetical protein